MNAFQKIIKEICGEEKINYSTISKDWVIMLEKDNKTRFISGYKFDLNSHGLGSIIDDKYATFEMLKKKNIPIIEHKIIFNKTNSNEYAKGLNNYEPVKEFFDENNCSIVIKANDGTCGNEVYHLTDYGDVVKCLDDLFIKKFSISMCPFYNIKTEYRLIILKNECLLIYGKKRPIVIGDGKKSIRELLREFNSYYFKDRLLEDKYDKVLDDGEVYEYGWQFNLSQGSIPFEVKDDNLKKRLLDFVKNLTGVIDIGFCSVDIIETFDDELLVMELNSGIMMIGYMKYNLKGYNDAKAIYKKAILEMFKN